MREIMYGSANSALLKSVSIPCHLQISEKKFVFLIVGLENMLP